MKLLRKNISSTGKLRRGWSLQAWLKSSHKANTPSHAHAYDKMNKKNVTFHLPASLKSCLRGSRSIKYLTNSNKNGNDVCFHVLEAIMILLDSFYHVPFPPPHYHSHLDCIKELNAMWRGWASPPYMAIESIVQSNLSSRETNLCREDILGPRLVTTRQ